LGLLRLFLPRELHLVFKAITKMEEGLRELIAEKPNEEFRGVYVESGLSATRKNILAPGSIGVYSGGSNYNPAQVIRDASVKAYTEKIDEKLAIISDKSYAEISIADMEILISWTRNDETQSEHVWNPVAVAASINQLSKIKEHATGYVYVDRDRELDANRRETAGILSGGEFSAVPDDKIALYMLRTKAGGHKAASWWPQVRFPNGQYAFAFAV